MSTVYITQDTPGRNFLPAKKYGTLKGLLEGNVQIVLSAAPVIRKLRRRLRDFNDDDYLLLTGDPVIMGIAIAVAMEVNRGRVNLLKWDKRESGYYDVFVDMFHTGDDDDD
tara:strand:- start:1078 stop:1410 length:333 start_codon:yes stop_codon:yes gene_type:complete